MKLPLGFFRRRAEVAPAAPPRVIRARNVEDEDDDDGFVVDSFVKGAKEDYAAAAYAANPGEVPPSRWSETDLDVSQNFTWVRAAQDAISRNASILPIRCVEKTGDDKSKELPRKHPLVALMRRPNPLQTKTQFVELLIKFLESQGICYVRQSGEAATTQAMFILRPDKTYIQTDRRAFIRGYAYRVGGEDQTIPPEDVFYHRYPDPKNEYLGLSPLTSLRRAIQSEDYIQTWNNNIFVNGARIDYVLTAPTVLAENVAKRVWRAFIQQVQGIKNAFKIGILDGGVDLKALTIPPRDLEFLLQRKYNRDEILAVYGVPPIMVGVTETVNYSTANEQRRSFWEQTMIPKLIGLEETLTEYVARPFGEEFAIEFDLSQVEALKENANERTTRTVAQWTGGLISRNQALEELSFPALPPEQGDVWILPPNVRLINAAGEDVTPSNPNAPAVPQFDENGDPIPPPAGGKPGDQADSKPKPKGTGESDSDSENAQSQTLADAEKAPAGKALGDPADARGRPFHY